MKHNHRNTNGKLPPYQYENDILEDWALEGDQFIDHVFSYCAEVIGLLPHLPPNEDGQYTSRNLFASITQCGIHAIEARVAATWSAICKNLRLAAANLHKSILLMSTIDRAEWVPHLEMSYLCEKGWDLIRLIAHWCGRLFFPIPPRTERTQS